MTKELYHVAKYCTKSSQPQILNMISRKDQYVDKLEIGMHVS